MLVTSKINFEGRVAHHVNTDSNSLPYVYGHHQWHEYSILLRTVLIRAARCCTDVFDFANEFQHTQLSFEYNRFNRDFYQKRMSNPFWKILMQGT